MSDFNMPITYEELIDFARAWDASWGGEVAGGRLSTLCLLYQWESEKEDINEKLSRCESPIERSLCLALARRLVAGPLMWETQKQIGKCRGDIVIIPYDDDGDILAVIECDGHAYHDRTKEQARRDKKRDRAMMRNGLPVFRFTGSEIFADADKCASEIVEAVEDILARRRPS